MIWRTLPFLLLFHPAWANQTFSVMHPTIYYKPVFYQHNNSCEPVDLIPLMSPDNKVLTQLCQRNFARCLMEGACSVFEDQGTLRSFNFYQKGVDGVARFKEIDRRKCPFGYGVKNICLDPYYSVAADLKIYSVGDVIFVPKIVGQVMPDGETHDGFFVIRDAGAAIQGAQRFDFYTGYTLPFSVENPFFRLGFADIKNNIEYRLATEDEALRIRNKTQYPGTQKNVVLPPQKEIPSAEGISAGTKSN